MLSTTDELDLLSPSRWLPERSGNASGQTETSNTWQKLVTLWTSTFADTADRFAVVEIATIAQCSGGERSVSTLRRPKHSHQGRCSPDNLARTRFCRYHSPSRLWSPSARWPLVASYTKRTLEDSVKSSQMKHLLVNQWLSCTCQRIREVFRHLHVTTWMRLAESNLFIIVHHCSLS